MAQGGRWASSSGPQWQKVPTPALDLSNIFLLILPFALLLWYPPASKNSLYFWRGFSTVNTFHSFIKLEGNLFEWSNSLLGGTSACIVPPDPASCRKCDLKRERWAQCSWSTPDISVLGILGLCGPFGQWQFEAKMTAVEFLVGQGRFLALGALILALFVSDSEPTEINYGLQWEQNKILLWYFTVLVVFLAFQVTSLCYLNDKSIAPPSFCMLIRSETGKGQDNWTGLKNILLGKQNKFM